MIPNGLGTSVNDYTGGVVDQAVHGNATSTAELAELNKALEATAITGGASVNQQTPGSGAPLKVESLENTLKVLTFKEQDIKLWKNVPKKAAYNTVEEYNQLADYGIERGGFTNEGELPQEEDSTYVRRAEQVKFIGVTKAVTHPMQLVNVTGVPSAIQAEIKAGTMWILRKANTSITKGDSSIIPQEYNGFYTQQKKADVFGSLDAWQDSEVVIDKRGKHLTQDDIEDATEGIIENFGFANTLFAPPKVLSNFVKKDYYPKQRILLNGDASFTGGSRLPKTVSTTNGDVDLISDIFMRSSKGRVQGDAAQSGNAPAAPAIAAAAAADGTSRFVDFDGDYLVGVAAINRFGESALITAGTAVSVTSADSIDLTITDNGGANPATGFVIYRSKVGDVGAEAKLFPVFSVSTAELATGFDGAVGGAVRDKNRYIPGTDSAFAIEKNEEIFSFRQLAPLMKMDLAILSPAYRFMILLYGTPILYAPKKMVRFINVGELDN